MRNVPPDVTDWSRPRPVPGSYWLIPGRLLVGEYPAARSRADSLARLRNFMDMGITCFVDLTDPEEGLSYHALLPEQAPNGKRVEYFRHSIPDHAVPRSREVVVRALESIGRALAADHCVYLHCRAGVGRSATVAGCWLANELGDARQALAQLQSLWRQSSRSAEWIRVPETDEQENYILEWFTSVPAAPASRSVIQQAETSVQARLRGALRGLALGDAMAAARADGILSAGPLRYTQHTALALCLARSLVERGRSDARDQIERYLRWQREGYCAADGRPQQPSPDIGRALGTYLWRKLPMAGSHDPADTSSSSLPRVVTAVAYAINDPTAAVALAAEASRTTHQSPIILDACRYLAAQLLVAVTGGLVDTVLSGVAEPVPGMWQDKPLRAEVQAMATGPGPRARAGRPAGGHADALRSLDAARTAVLAGGSFESVIANACKFGHEPALEGALAGALYGAFHGVAALPPARWSALEGADQVEQVGQLLEAHAMRGSVR